MDRRGFIRSVAVASAGAALAVSHRVACAEAEVAATTKRFSQQRWALDNIIRANGVDWDQPRSIYLSAPCGVEANADFAAIRARVQKMADIGPAFESTAKRREARARAAEADGNPVTARDNWYMAAIHYGAAEDAVSRHARVAGEPGLRRVMDRSRAGACARRSSAVAAGVVASSGIIRYN